jgi:hypothetical protein
MIKKFMIIAAIASFAILTGCASVPMASKEQDKVVKSFKLSSNDKAGLYVYRNCVVGFGVTKAIYLDGFLLGETANKTFFYKEITPGKHQLVTESELSNNNLTFQADGGKNYFVEQVLKTGISEGGAYLQIVFQEEGMNGILKCGLAVSTGTQIPIKSSIRVAQTQYVNDIPVGTSIQINSLEDSEIISRGSIDNYEKAKITILEITENGIVTVKGSFGINQGNMGGIITLADSNQTVQYDLNKDKWFMCVGQIILAPNLKLKLSASETLLSGPDGARFKKPVKGKVIILIEGAANLIKYSVDN